MELREGGGKKMNGQGENRSPVECRLMTKRKCMKEEPEGTLAEAAGGIAEEKKKKNTRSENRKKRKLEMARLAQIGLTHTRV